jgi:hypothetical protein
MNIEIKTINHKKQRVGEVGDYWKNKDKTVFAISKMTPEYEMLVTVHEVVEYFLVRQRGILLKNIDEFDKNYYKNKNGEAGNDPKAPYHKEHLFATRIERLLAKELKINWKEYDKYIMSL